MPPKKENRERSISGDNGFRHFLEAIAKKEYVVEIKQNRNGFTLIELIVAIAILGVLVALSVPSFISYIEKSREASDRYELRALNGATRVYYASEPSPNPFEVMGTTDTVLLQTLVGEGFFSEIPVPEQEDASYTWDYSSKVWLLSGTSEDLTHVLTASDVSLGTESNWFKHAIMNYTGTATEISIPNSINDVNIERIYQDAFNGKNLTSVTFSADSGIVQIHARAFQNNKLTEIALPTSLKNLDIRAFYGNNITKVTIGSDVTVAGSVFGNDNLFRDAYIANGKSAGTYIYTNGQWVKQ